MDRLSELAFRLNTVLDELQTEASQQHLQGLQAPLAWLDEANGWLAVEIERVRRPGVRDDAPPFVYIPVELRK
jgi:hypothetical protein